MACPARNASTPQSRAALARANARVWKSGRGTFARATLAPSKPEPRNTRITRKKTKKQQTRASCNESASPDRSFFRVFRVFRGSKLEINECLAAVRSQDECDHQQGSVTDSQERWRQTPTPALPHAEVPHYMGGHDHANR